MEQTEFPFTLPRGYVDSDGGIHRDGVMRLATAFDEIAPLKDPRVQANPGYLVIVLLSRVIIRLGTVDLINPKVIENLYMADLTFLQTFYQKVNKHTAEPAPVTCPNCQKTFTPAPPAAAS